MGEKFLFLGEQSPVLEGQWIPQAGHACLYTYHAEVYEARSHTATSRAELGYLPAELCKRHLGVWFLAGDRPLLSLAPERKGIRKRCSQDPIRILGTIAEPTGTDGRPIIPKHTSVTGRQM